MHEDSRDPETDSQDYAHRAIHSPHIKETRSDVVSGVADDSGAVARFFETQCDVSSRTVY